jgi:hypothetical protein
MYVKITALTNESQSMGFSQQRRISDEVKYEFRSMRSSGRIIGAPKLLESSFK